MSVTKHLAKARELHRLALCGLERARRDGNVDLLRDACAKGWRAAIEAANALFVKRGIKEEELPKIDRGRRFMIHRFAERETEWLYFSLRDNLHIEGYYEGSLSPEEVERHLGYLEFFIQKVEGEEGG